MKTTVFLTGATGTMGWAGLKELLAHKENYNIRILARPSEKNRRKLSSCRGKNRLPPASRRYGGRYGTYGVDKIRRRYRFVADGRHRRYDPRILNRRTGKRD